MRLQEIEAFLAVCKYGSFTRAAEKTFTTQPTITQRIISLEREFHTELFERGKGLRHITLTPAGRLFLPQAKKWSRLWRETETLLATAQTESHSIASVMSFTEYAFPAINRKFQALDLNCSLKMAGGTSASIYTMVENGDYDCGLVCILQQSARVHVLPLASEQLLFVCRTDARYSDTVDIAELRGSEHVRIQWTLESSAWYQRWFGNSGKPLVDVTGVRDPSIYFSIPDAWTIIPASSLSRLNSSFRVCRLSDPPPNRIFSLISQTPVREPFFSAVQQALCEEFSKIDLVELLVH